MPITVQETDDQIDQIIGPQCIDGFMRWVNDPTNNQSMISVVERVRARIQETNGFTEKDLMRT